MTNSDRSDLDHGQYRQFLPDLSLPRFTTMQQQDAHKYAKAFKTGGSPPWLHSLYLHWRRLFQEPYRGITTDGIVRPGLFKIQDEGIPMTTIVEAANHLLSRLSDQQREIVSHHIDSPEWRSWSNPEFLLSDKGLRLDELPGDIRDAIMRVLESALSPQGYQKAVSAMKINGFLGHLVKAPRICNEFSYNFVLFGQPSTEKPWGFSFYGHHLCLNILLYRSQIITSPWFTGAEPNIIDEGPEQGTQILQVEERLGLQLMRSLPAHQQKQAQIYALLRDPAMPAGRWNHDDQRHLCGAYRDNRIVPYEGVLASEMSDAQRETLMGILAEYFLYLPETAMQMRLDEARRWLHETYFCWIGGFGDDDAFYYRIQSPVVIVEFDHHSGVFLTNQEPAKFHIHTLLRTPNGGDYGMALRPLMDGMEQGFVWEGK
ncbi:hypothetical protein PG999_010500 [Apiospora kogelbergensis]|uniref:DUF3500 domain-containing protein n=1 Tax=Apiospora kogelbergensis TaxID=1337665 RepID=A0AAW0QCS7_9PEZI